MFDKTLRTPKGLIFTVKWTGFTVEQHLEADLKDEFIIKAPNKELDELSVFIHQIMPFYGTKNEIREDLSFLYAFNLTVYHQEKRIGFLCTHNFYVPNGRVVLVIAFIGIIPEHRKKGFAKTALELEYFAVEDMLLTYAFNGSNVFWEKIGFRKLKETNLDQLKESVIHLYGKEMFEEFYVKELK